MQTRFSLFIRLLVLSLGGQNLSAVLVINTNDTGAGSLRQAITDVNGGTASGPIDFAPGLTGTINLTHALPTLNTNITINGPGAAVLTVRRFSGTNYAIFNIGVFTVNISGLTIANGTGVGTVSVGGGVRNSGMLTMSDCVFSNNTAWYGGGIGNNYAAVTVSNCLFRGNTAHSATGGAIEFYSSPGLGELNVVACTFLNNSSTNGPGGAIRLIGNGNISNSTFSNNAAPYSGAINLDDGNLRLTECSFVNNKALGGGSVGQNGGALFLRSTAALSNCTFSANTARGSGGALFLFTNVSAIAFTVEVASVTITLNTADTLASGTQFGGGVRVEPGVAIRFRNTIIASNLLGSVSTSGLDVSGTNFLSGGYNLVGKTNGATWTATTGDKLGSSASPMLATLGPLQNNGGPTWTHAPLAGSQVIDRGRSFGLVTDQRGKPRPYDFGGIANAPGGDGSDIGAYEFQSSSPVLSIVQSLNNVVLSWSTNDPGFSLESVTNISDTNWSPGGSPVIVNCQYTVSNSPSGPQRFYRLRQ